MTPKNKEEIPPIDADLDEAVEAVLLPKKKSDIPTATHTGELVIGGKTIPCAVLDNGERVIADRTLAKTLGIKGGGRYWEKKKENGALMPEYLSAKYLAPYISSELRDNLSNRITYNSKFGGLANGIRAIVLPQICDVWINADKNGALSEPQKKIAELAYILIKGFATVGIVALVDEATGYQYERQSLELQKILSAYISEETAKWQLTFSKDFYRQIARLWNNPSVNNTIKPSFVGKITNKYVYEMLPNGVLKMLKEKTPKTEKGNYKHKLHQHLTPEIGREHLRQQIIEVTTLMSVSRNKDVFKEFFRKKYNPQREFDFDY